MFKKFNTYNSKEVQAAIKVIKSGSLSNFIGEWGNKFYGGELIQKMERKYANYFKVKYAISVNSWTSGLTCAIGALDIEPGDEIILPTWTMSACAASILHWNAIPVFADIDPITLNIDVDSVKKNISKRTKAILAVDISGRPANIVDLKKIIGKKKVKIISDSAQSPHAKYDNKKFAGTIADIGGISLNYHKHIHTGEGGIIFTNNKVLAEKMMMIRNHAEAVLRDRKNFKLNNMIGYNFRLGEVEAAIAMEQLKKLKTIVEKRVKIANYLTSKLRDIPQLILPENKSDFSNVYYTYPIILNKRFKLSRNKILRYLKKKKIPGFRAGYWNLHLLPMFQKKIAYGKGNYPWNWGSRKISYKKGICPNAESLNDKYFIGFGISNYDLKIKDINLISYHFHQIFKKKY
tara:strand:- start:2263 stop:3477 length:1215 start_codon:yes stop_codon:yes gene_type:complete